MGILCSLLETVQCPHCDVVRESGGITMVGEKGKYGGKYRLEGRGDLLDTLRTFLATGLDRRRTAERLHIHPNTVDYRLRRTTALTGLSATHGPDLPRIQAALAAHGAWFIPCSIPGTGRR